jgi:putative transposase
VSRFRLYPTPAQEAALLGHCAQARFVWNLALEQANYYGIAGRKSSPSFGAQCRQLTEARSANEWLAAGSQTVQQQALRDLDQAWRNFYGGTHRRPTWRKLGRHDGFRIVGPQAGRVRKLNRKWAAALVPKVGWIRFRLSRAVPEAKSYRVTFRAGRWHIAFAAIPAPIPAPGTGEVVGVDRGVAVAAALSTGELVRFDTDRLDAQVRRTQRKLCRAKRGSNRRGRVKARLARLQARRADTRKDWVEKLSTDLARRFDLIRVEDLRVRNMTRSARGTVEQPGTNVRQKAGLNRAILSKGWGQLVLRLEQKAPGRVEKINAAYSSQRCTACGHTAPENRESQAIFRCRACGRTAHADLNAARNIAAGHVVTARGGSALAGPMNRELQHASL